MNVSSIAIKTPHVKQPLVKTRISKEWLSRGLVFAYVPDSNGGYDAVTGKRPSLTTNNSFPIFSTAQEGQVLRNANDGGSSNHGYITFSNLAIDNTNGATLVSQFIKDTTGAVYWQFLICGYDAAGTLEADITYGLSGETASPSGYQYMKAAANNYVTSADEIVEDEWHTMSSSVGYGASSLCDFWVDGIQVADDGASYTNSQALTDRIVLGGSVTWPTESWGGDISISLWFNREISPAEHMALAENIWQIFEPETIFMPGEPKLDLVHVPKPWTKQPPTGTKASAYWLNRGLSFLWNGAQPIVEVIHGTPFESTTVIDPGSLGVTKGGFVFIGDGATQNQMIKFPSPLGQASGHANLSVGMHFHLKDVDDTADARMFSKWANGAGAWFLRKRRDTSQGSNGNFEFFVQDTSGDAYVGTITLFNETDNFHTVIGTYGNSIGSIYLDGHGGHGTFGAGSGPSVVDVSHNIVIQGTDGEGSIESTMDIALCFTFDSLLTEGELESLGKNPWQLFEPETIFIPGASELNLVIF